MVVLQHTHCNLCVFFKWFPGRVDTLVEVDKEIPTIGGRGRCRDRVDVVEKLDTRSKRFRLDLSLDWTFQLVFPATH